MKNLGILLVLLMGVAGSAQSVLNNYKYVIVPTQFEGFRSENQYQTSTLVKYYLAQNGVNAYYDNAAPEELNFDRCLALYVSLDDQSTTFKTAAAVVFKDCKGREQYRTQIGNSKDKQYMEAYRETIGEAFNSLKGYRYTYQEPAEQAPVVIAFGDDVKKLPPASDLPQVPEEVKETEVVEVPKDKEETTLMPLPDEETEAVTLEEAVAQDSEAEVAFPSSLYAQKTETGYQLVDTTPSIRFYLRETSFPNLYLAERRGEQGILFLLDDKWIFEFYRGADRIQEELQIKF